MIQEFNPLSVKWEDLTVKKQTRYKPKDVEKESVSIDTETDKKGNIFLLADSYGNYVWHPGINETLEFLTNKIYHGKYITAWNMSFDADGFIKQLPIKNINEIVKQKETTYKEYKLKFFRKKLFIIKTRNKCFYIYDVSQFYAYQKLDVSAKKYLHSRKNNLYAKEFTGKYIKENKQKIIKYCIQDCKLTQKLTSLLTKKLWEMNIKPTHLISTASISEHYFRKNCFVPTINKHIPLEAIEYAYKSYFGGRFEIIKRGVVQADLYDINSAYPDEIQNLIDLTMGAWIKEKQPREKAHYGFMKVIITQKNEIINPFPYRWKRHNNLTVYPTETFHSYITLQEYNAYKNMEKINIKIIKGWYYYPSASFFPFKKIIKNLYKRRLKEKDEIFNLIIKIIMNSFYGKMIQKIDCKTGALFNPIYASVITANTRIKLLEFIKKQEDKVLGFATDSVLVTKDFKSKKKYLSKTKLGKWGIEASGKTLIVKSGMYTIKDSHGKVIKKRFRTFGRNIDLFKLFEEYRNTSTISLKKFRPQHLNECFVQKKIDKINEFVEIEKTLNLNADFKRIWNGRGTTKNLLNNLQSSIPTVIY